MRRDIHEAVVIFEIEGGNDKTIHGNRVDTKPIVEALQAAGWHAEVVVYRPEWTDKIFDYVAGSFDAYISRVNPGNIPGGEDGYFALLERLADAGLAAFSRPAEISLMVPRTRWSSSMTPIWCLPIPRPTMT